MPASDLSRKIAEALWRDWEYCGDVNAPPMDEEDAAHLADLIERAGVGELEAKIEAMPLIEEGYRAIEAERDALAKRIEAALSVLDQWQHAVEGASVQKAVRILRGEES